MNRHTLPLILTASTLLAVSSLSGCRSNSATQAPVATSASPAAFHYNPNDLRPPLTFVEGRKDTYRSLPSLADPSDTDIVPPNRPGQVGLANASAAATFASGASNALALAAGLYVEAQHLEGTHAYPQAVAAYDRLLEREANYADAQARRDTLMELIVLADEYYVLAMDTESPDQRLHYLRQIHQYWPGYRDVEAQIQQLKRAALQALLELAEDDELWAE